MEKGRRGLGLTAFFWRYLLACGALAAGIALLWALLFETALRGGLVLPASAGEAAASRLVRRALETGAFAPEDAPHYVRWARFSPEGDALDAAGMDGARLNAARAELAGDSFPHGFPYANYHRSALLSDGSALVLQYDFAMPYADARLSGRLPDFQIAMLLALLLLWAAALALTTRRFARVLRGDAQALGKAARAVAERRLDAPCAGRARVRELSGALEAIEALRASLSDALKAQWAAEARARDELAALAHDIRTPLTAVLGHADLLLEGARDEVTCRSAEAIVSEAERLRAYAGTLDALSRGEAEARTQADAAALFADWQAMGEALCAARGARFSARCAAAGRYTVEREALSRAVGNLLDNAARMTPPGGEVTLEAEDADGLLRVRVEDGGPGFSREALARAGYALYTSEAERGGHRGVGLCYARRVTERSGGTLTLANRPEGGARVELTVRGEVG